MTSPLATIAHELTGDSLVVTVRGEIDVSNGEDMHAAVLDCVTLDTRRVALDLTEVEYFDSVGVRLVFDFHQRLAGQGIRFCVVRPPDSYVCKVLELCGADQVVAAHDDLASATIGDR